MPISRFHIRSEHSLADPELHRSANKEDPEALLEAVAMAGLVGVLRQLGDLAQFAAEVFHDLHEEVLATAARGHSLVSRVQQLEAEVPALEKAFLSQTHHSSFFTNGGIDWHPNLRSEQNLIARGDLPQFIMDSYQECRGPPRLFLLDKFDVAGAGACLKRYTDPSFFKADSASSVMATVDVHREKRIRKVKQKKVAQPRNGESPLSSHAKLHQLFLEERIENACRDPARLVKLKKKQLNGSAVESKSGKSYMEKILDISSPDHKMVSETSTTPLPVQLLSNDTSENGIKILEISSVSPVKRSLGNESTHSSQNEQELEMKPYSERNREINGDIMHVHEEVSATVSVATSNIHKVADDTELRVDEQTDREYCIDGYHSDDVTSEVDDYMDALATMEEFETDIECRPKKSLIHIQKVTDSNGKAEHQLQTQFSDSQSYGDSLTSEEISSFSRDRNGEHAGGQAPLSDSHSSRSSSASEDNRLTRRDRIEHYQLQAQFSDSQSIGNSSTSEIENVPSNQLFQTVELPKTEFGEFVMHRDELVHEKEISDCRPVSPGSGLMDSGLLSSDLGSTLSLPLVTQSGETPSGYVEMYSRSGHEDRKSHVESTFVISDALPLIKDDGCHMVSSDNKSLKNLDVCEPLVNSNEFNLAYGDEYGDHSMTEVLPEESPNQQISEILSSGDIGSQGEDPICSSMEAEFNSGTKLLLDGLDLKSKNGVIATQQNSEDLSPVVETPLVSSFAEELGSDFTHGKLQGEPVSEEAEVLYSDQQSNFEEVSRMMLGDGHIKHLSSPDIRQDNLVIVNDASTEKVHSEDQPLSALPLVDRAENDAIIFTSEASGFVSSPSRNLSDLHEPFSTPSNSHPTVIEPNEGELTKISVDLHSEKRENKLQPSSDTLPSPMKRHTKWKESHSTFAGSHEKEMEVHEEVAKESLTDFMVPKQVDQPEIASFDLQPNLNRSVPCDPTDHEIYHTIQDTKSSSDVNDTKLVSVSPELDSQRLESIFLCQNDVQNSKDSLSLPFHEVGQPDAAVWVRNEEHYASEKFQLQQSEISNQLEQQRISHAASEQLQHSSFDSSPKSSFQETNYTKHATVLLQPALPDLSVQPTNNHEGMPPLPPLPPMQWRMGKVQHTSPVSQIEEIEGSQTSFQPIQPVKPDDKSQLGLSTPDRDTILYQNPFLPFMGVESNMLQHSSGFLAGGSEHPVAIPLHFPIMVNESNGQYNYLVMERSQNQNPFLTLPMVSVGGPPHGYVYGSEGEMVQNSSPCPSIPPGECSVSETDPVSPQEKLTESPTQLMEKTSLEVKDGPGELHSVLPTECAVPGDDPISPKASPPHRISMEETGLEVEKHEQSSIDLESKQEGDPSISTMSPPIIDIKQPNDSPPPSEGKMALPLDTSARAPEFDSKMPNGKPKNKLPPPQNPLIDIVAAIDKSRLRKVSERVRPQIAPKVDERDSLLEQIRSKSFNLRPAVATRPITQGPRTNLRVAAILEKANSIRQALAGSDEDDDADSWSDS